MEYGSGRTVLGLCPARRTSTWPSRRPPHVSREPGSSSLPDRLHGQHRTIPLSPTCPLRSDGRPAAADRDPRDGRLSDALNHASIVEGSTPREGNTHTTSTAIWTPSRRTRQNRASGCWSSRTASSAWTANRAAARHSRACCPAWRHRPDSTTPTRPACWARPDRAPWSTSVSRKATCCRWAPTRKSFGALGGFVATERTNGGVSAGRRPPLHVLRRHAALSGGGDPQGHGDRRARTTAQGAGLAPPGLRGLRPPGRGLHDWLGIIRDPIIPIVIGDDDTAALISQELFERGSVRPLRPLAGGGPRPQPHSHHRHGEPRTRAPRSPDRGADRRWGEVRRPLTLRSTAGLPRAALPPVRKSAGSDQTRTTHED